MVATFRPWRGVNGFCSDLEGVKSFPDELGVSCNREPLNREAKWWGDAGLYTPVGRLIEILLNSHYWLNYWSLISMLLRAGHTNKSVLSQQIGFCADVCTELIHTPSDDEMDLTSGPLVDTGKYDLALGRLKTRNSQMQPSAILVSVQPSNIHFSWRLTVPLELLRCLQGSLHKL